MYVCMYVVNVYRYTRETVGSRYGDVSAPAARRMVRTLLWPPLPHHTLANIGYLSLSLTLTLLVLRPFVRSRRGLSPDPGHLDPATSRVLQWLVISKDQLEETTPTMC